MSIRIKVIGENNATRILSKEDSIKIGRKIINTEIVKAAFLAGIEIGYQGLKFYRVDV